jgi:hypothetical protein
MRRAAPLCIALAALLAACAPPAGDFGRRADGVMNSTVLPTLGLAAATTRGEMVSFSPLTEDEIELRDRGWRFLMPANDRAVFLKKIAELQAARVLPPEVNTDPTVYHGQLMSERFRSTASRHARLREDMEADRLLIGPFSAVAARVCEADRLREQALAHVQDLSAMDVREARSRMGENAATVDWVYREFGYRVRAYRYSLEHLLLQAPDRAAIEGERALLRLEKDLATVRELGPCERLATRRWGSTDGVVLDRHRSRLRINDVIPEGPEVLAPGKPGDGTFAPAHPPAAPDPGGRVVVPK